jgi:hypothetical protein
VILSLQTRLGDLATAVATDVKQLRVWITGSSSGALTGLTTTTKTDIVSAINEINAKPTSGAPPDATETARGVIELATLAEVATGTDAVRAVTPAGVRQERKRFALIFSGLASRQLWIPWTSWLLPWATMLTLPPQ